MAPPVLSMEEKYPLEKLIQSMPVLVQEGILKELIAVKKKREKRVLSRPVVHRDLLGWDAVHRNLLGFFKFLQALAEEALEEDELEALQLEMERQEEVNEALALEYAIEHDVSLYCNTCHRFTMLCDR